MGESSRDQSSPEPPAPRTRRAMCVSSLVFFCTSRGAGGRGGESMKASTLVRGEGEGEGEETNAARCSSSQASPVPGGPLTAPATS